MSASAGLAFLFLIACMSLAAAPVMRDERIAHPFDKDHPASFNAEFKTRQAWEKRADFLRRQSLVALGLWPEPVKAPLDPVIHGEIERQDYTVSKVFFASMPGHYVSGNLYRPRRRAGKVPAVLCPYGHWPDGRFIWRSDADVKKATNDGSEIEPGGARSPLQASCAMLARMGCVVFTYDMVGYCDSTKIPHREGFTDVQSVLRLQSFMGLQTWNSIRALDFVLGLPEVDPDRIAITGSSGGGTQSIALAAVDPRVAVVFPMVMISMNMQGGCICENAPLLRVGTNNVELASLPAPKPVGAVAANDWTIDFETRGLPEMTRIWELFDAAGNVAGHHVNFGHNHNVHSRQLQYEFLNKHLNLGRPSPVKEVPFEPIPPRELSVYDAGDPLPGDAKDASGLRDSMTRASDEMLKTLAMDPDKYAEVLRTALEVMVVDSMPSPGDVEVMEASSPQPPVAGMEWSAIISRKSAGERVKCKVILPAGWDGTVAIFADAKGVTGLNHADPAVKLLLDRRIGIAAIDMFPNQPYQEPATRPGGTRQPRYSAFLNGYNRTTAANRVHDLLTTIAMVRGWDKTRSLWLAGFGEAGPTALLARALAGDAIERAAIDLNRFDFDAITDDADPMLLPGAVKYGGIYSFATLCNSGKTLLCNARPGARLPGLPVEVRTDGGGSAAMIEWLLR